MTFTSEHLRRYKRDLCKFHAEGHCWRGEDCTFAHGLEEMYRSDAAEARRDDRPTGATSRGH